MIQALSRAIAVVVVVALTIVGLAACVRHIDLYRNAPPADARRNDSGSLDDVPSDGFINDGFIGDARPLDALGSD